MTRARRPSRLVPSVLTALGVLAAVALTTVPAHAVAASGINAAQTGFAETGPASCNVSNSGTTNQVPFSSNGVTSTRTASGSSTIVDTGDATDITTATASSKSVVKATEAAGSLTSFDWQATLKSKVSATQGAGTDCDATATAAAYNVLSTITIAKPQWLTLSGDMEQAVATMVLSRTAPVSPPWSQTMVFVGAHSQPDIKLLLPAGTYSATIVASLVASAPGGSFPSTQAADIELTGTLVPVGTATSKTTGTAKKYLQLNKVRKCSADQLKAKFRAAAGDGPNAKVKKATFFANGDKIKTVGLPIRGDRVTLSHLPSDDEVTVKARLKLFGGGVVTATRSYLSCT